MTKPQRQPERTFLQRLLPLTFPIRGKIIFPYLILTFLVAIVGTYVVVNLVAGSLDERLTNHLLEAGRVVSDSLAQYEMGHLEAARVVAFTRGLAEAVQAGDAARVQSLASPAAAGLDLDCLIIVDARKRVIFHTLRRPDGSYAYPQDALQAPEIAAALLEAGDPQGLPRRGIGRHPTNGLYYYLTAIPLSLNDQLVGVVIVGSPLDLILTYLQSTSMANVTIYLDNGRAVGTTFALPEHPIAVPTLLEELSISASLYEKSLFSTQITVGENVQIRGRWYRLAFGPLRVGNDTLGVFSVALPAHYIVHARATSRNIYALLFALATVAVIATGYVIARRITRPLEQLVHASRAIAEGDLHHRTSIRSTDEIGVLASTFDEMAQRLLERTNALEETLGQLRAILASIGDGVILEDARGEFIPLNAAAEHLLTEMADNFMLGPLRELPVTEPEPASGETKQWSLENRRFQVGNKMISANSAVVRTEDGQRLGTVIVLRDITAEVEAERLKDAFVAHVSHELRTPLTAIKGYSSLLLSGAGGNLSEQQRAFLTTIQRHTESLIAMIGTLLDFTEMEAGGRLALRPRRISLASLAEEIAQEWRPHMEDNGLTFHLEIPPDLPPVMADPQRLRWAIVNLLRNASQYTPRGGEVALRLSFQDNWVVVNVTTTNVSCDPANPNCDRAGGPPDGQELNLDPNEAVILDFGEGTGIIDGEGPDLVFYEWPNWPGIHLDFIIIEISADGTNWYTVFAWDGTFGGVEGTNVDSYAMDGNGEQDNEQIPAKDLYPYPGTGVTIDIGPWAPAGYSYRYVRLRCPFNGGDAAQVDAVQRLH